MLCISPSLSFPNKALTSQSGKSIYAPTYNTTNNTHIIIQFIKNFVTFFLFSITSVGNGQHPQERKVVGWAARDTTGILSPYFFTLRKTGTEDVAFKVLYCGVDHTDLHRMRNELHMTTYPFVPGHEVVGVAVELGSKVKKFRLGEIVGVGCIVGSCGECSLCASNIEQYCSNRIFTYNDIYKDGIPTQGGFSSAMVVHHKFVVKIPEKLTPEQAAPLLCAGVTAYSPLRHF
ncbi:hypothetical protein AAC387_Pa03g4310 [Persea americana]